MERLRHERALALGEAIDLSTRKSYGSALNSYLNFVLLHHLPIEPTDDILSLYVVWTAHYIKPDSVDSYLQCGPLLRMADTSPEEPHIVRYGWR
jgi:hypothetical protein